MFSTFTFLSSFAELPW